MRSPKTHLLIVLAASAFALIAGCFGTEVPPQTPAKDPMADATPVQPTADPLKREDAPGERKGKFDKEQVTKVLSRAVRTASECPKIHTEGPFGEVNVIVELSSSKGRVSDAKLPAPFDGTPIGKCVEKAYEAEIIPNWDGPDERMESKVVLKKPDQVGDDKGKDDKGKDDKSKGGKDAKPKGK